MSDANKFEQAMREGYQRARDEYGYNALRFLRMINKHGGVGAAKKLLGTSGWQTGFTELYLKEILHLSVEHLVLSADWGGLFSAEELKEAERRLIEMRHPLPSF